MSPRQKREATLCRYHPGNDFQMVTGLVVHATAYTCTLLIDRTEVVFSKPPWMEVAE